MTSVFILLITILSYEAAAMTQITFYDLQSCQASAELVREKLGARPHIMCIEVKKP